MSLQEPIRRYFGTDGIRGRVGDAPITPEFVLRLGWAAGKVFSRRGVRRILIGKDTRISGYMLESALEAGLSAAGVDVHLTGPMPTPGVAYLTRTFRCDAGVVISASHNPYDDNGIKFFSPTGNKLPDEVEDAIERELDAPMSTVDSAALGKASRVDDAAGRYIEFCKATVRSGFRIPGLSIVLDCAQGATYHVAPAVFGELGARVTAINTAPDGLNINAECGSTHTDAIVRKVREIGADLGIAFDGDGDRVIMLDDRGEVVDGDQIVYIIARQRHRAASLGGGVVGTLMSNLGLERGLAELDIPFVRTPVGDRYVLAELEARDWLIGGEASGHVVCRDVHTTGDGIISALQVLCALDVEGQSLREAAGAMKSLPQEILNVAVPEPKRVMDAAEVVSEVARIEKHLGARGRVLLRPSGTERVVRVMLEGEDRTEIETLTAHLGEVVRGTSCGVAS